MSQIFTGCSNMDALYYNWANHTPDSVETREKFEKINRHMDALSLSYRRKDEILCAVSEYAERGKYYGFIAGFITAINLLLREAVAE